ncbi:MAG: Fe-S cluster assembly ATPase SufC [Rickettsiales bacterium]
MLARALEGKSLMLDVNDVYAGPNGVDILKGFSFAAEPGKVYALMGPNGAGKSTLSHVLAGRPGYAVRSGEIVFENENIAPLSVSQRAAKGIFVAFQYPVEIPGVTCMNFLKSSVSAVRRARGEGEPDAVSFLKEVRVAAASLNISDDMLKRAVNFGFSGGEKKRFEALHMAMLQPKLIVLDETDSGLDVDALRTVSECVNAMRSPDRSFIVITHYKRLLDYVTPDAVYIMDDGAVRAKGGMEIADTLEKKGYKAFGIVDKAECVV